MQGSRQFKDFEEYLLSTEKFASLKQAKQSPIAVTNDCSKYLQDRLLLLDQQLDTVNLLAKTNELPDAIFTASGLKITPLTNSVPIEAETLTQQVYSSGAAIKPPLLSIYS